MLSKLQQFYKTYIALFITCNALMRPVACYLSTAYALINGIRSTPGFRGEDSLINRSRYEY